VRLENRVKRMAKIQEIAGAGALRQLETRHKIELGGLVLRSGITELLGVPRGAEMKTDFRKEAAVILGILLAGVEALRGPDNAAKLERLAAKGYGALRE
jgi:hypothetical protein